MSAHVTQPEMVMWVLVVWLSGFCFVFLGDAWLLCCLLLFLLLLFWLFCCCCVVSRVSLGLAVGLDHFSSFSILFASKITDFTNH